MTRSWLLVVTVNIFLGPGSSVFSQRILSALCGMTDSKKLIISKGKLFSGLKFGHFYTLWLSIPSTPPVCLCLYLLYAINLSIIFLYQWYPMNSHLLRKNNGQVNKREEFSKPSPSDMSHCLITHRFHVQPDWDKREKIFWLSELWLLNILIYVVFKFFKFYC